jgi:hypothetical protein
LHFFFNSCKHPEKKTGSVNKADNIDSLKNSVEEQFNETLATLDSAIGASQNTIKDSILIPNFEGQRIQT